MIINRIRFLLKIFNKNAKEKHISIKGNLSKNCNVFINSPFRIQIGQGFWLGCNSRLGIRKGSTFVVGEKFSANNNFFCGCQNKIIIGDNVNIGPNVIIVDNDHDYTADDRRNTYIKGEVKIGNNVWIGANCIILKNSTIGDNCVIAAGTTVKGIIPSNTIAYNKLTLICKPIK